MNNKYKKIFILVILLELYNIIINFYSQSSTKKYEEKLPLPSNNIIRRDLYKELTDLQIYVDNVLNGVLIDKNKTFYPSKNPKISVVISVYNGEGFLKSAILSIQNQDFKDIEIVIVDDSSKDKSISLIKNLMINEPRIVLFKNNVNRGALYTKTKGILLSKGKYIMMLDEDDIFVQRDAFSILYNEAERNNLDLLEFSILISKTKINIIKGKITKPIPPIILQPELGEKLFKHTSDGEVNWVYSGNIVNCFVKKDIYIKAIKQIDKKYLDTKINCHDDVFIFYLLTKTANNFKYIERFFYLVFLDLNQTDTKVQFRTKEKNKDRENLCCLAYFNFIQFIFEKTYDTFYDKKVAFFNYKTLLLNNPCRNNTNNREKAINISNLFLNNKYIAEKDKKEIKLFLNETI